MSRAYSIAGNLPVKNANTVSDPPINRLAWAIDYVREYTVENSDNVNTYGDILFSAIASVCY